MKSKALIIGLLCSLTACHGMFDDIYDEPQEHVDIKEGQLYIDASSWTDWHYINLNATTDKVVRIEIPTEAVDASHRVSPPSLGTGGLYAYWYDVFGEGLSKHEYRSFIPTAPQPEPDEWHIAVHRNNVRTNGGAVYETPYTSMKNLPESSEAFADATFTEDTWNELDVWVIQSQMLQGLIGSQGIKVNPVLSSWLKVNLPPVPPTFTLNNHVFIIKFKDGTFGAIQLENYQSPTGVKCCLTINYKYPY